MSHPSDEFGDSLSEMFPDLGEDSDMPELEKLTNFSSGPVFRQVPSPYTDTHLVCLFTVHDCAICHSHTRTGVNFAIRRVHSSRNSCIEYQAVLPEMHSLYSHLPKAFKEVTQTDPFCLACATKAGFHLNSDFL